METRSKADPLVAALRRPRYEVIPLDGTRDSVLEHVPTDVTLTVTASPVRGMEPTLALTERLTDRGYRVVPHLAARLVRDGSHLTEVLGRLDGAGVREVFVVAGDAPEAAGGFEGAVSLLRAMSNIGSSIEEIGVGGYPEGHPIIPEEDAARSLEEKAVYASRVVSQICFSPEVIEGWVGGMRDRGITLPLYIGIPAPVSNRKLLRVSSRIGLGESARFLRKHGNLLLRMFLPGGYSPDALLNGLRPAVEDARNDIRGFHIYTFNELGGIEAWRKRIIESVERGTEGKGYDE
ncbi:MAG: methylenetetrahydrofolate reductase [Rubrobacter sp.]